MWGNLAKTAANPASLASGERACRGFPQPVRVSGDIDEYFVQLPDIARVRLLATQAPGALWTDSLSNAWIVSQNTTGPRSRRSRESL